MRLFLWILQRLTRRDFNQKGSRCWLHTDFVESSLKAISL